MHDEDGLMVVELRPMTTLRRSLTCIMVCMRGLQINGFLTHAVIILRFYMQVFVR